MNEIFLEADLLQEMIEHQARSQEINEDGADRIIDGCNIDQGHPIKELQKSVRRVTCPKVPSMLRKGKRSKEYFDPRILSFGPYHHGKPELQEGETLKTKLMLKFIEQSSKSVQEFYSKVREMNYDNRACYVDGSTNDYDDNEFASMMLRDGCFILYMMDLSLNSWEMLAEEFKCRYDILPYIFPDMILLENQIPFAVLELLMSLKNDEKVGPGMITRFVYLFIWGILEMAVTGDENKKKQKLEKPSVHLLEFIYKELSKDSDQNDSSKSGHFFNFCKIWSTQTKEPAFALTEFIPSFRSVRELKAKGIHFKPSNSSLAKNGKSISLRDVEFRSRFLYAELKLPTLVLDPAKIKVYNNLAAFEWCPPTVNDLLITSYICFLNTLIDGPDDVRELRSKRILLNNVGSDQEVVELLREMTTFERQDITLYHGVRKAIEKHCNSKKRTWVAEITYKYFSTPMATLGLFAAITVLVLTVVQTCFTIHPVKEK